MREWEEVDERETKQMVSFLGIYRYGQGKNIRKINQEKMWNV